MIRLTPLFSLALSSGIAACGPLTFRPVLPPTHNGFGETSVTDLNDSGLAVGRSDYSYTDSAGNIHTTSGTFDWNFTDTPAPVITNHGLFTNNRGDRVTAGSAVINSVFIRGEDGAEFPIPPLPGHTFAIAQEIAADGVVVGTSGVFRIGALAAFMWSEQTGTVDLTGLVPLARDAVSATDNGYIVGHRPASDGSHIHAYFLDRESESWTDLYRYFNPDAPTGQGRTLVHAVNRAGEAVGETTFGGGFHAYIWSEADGHTFIPNPFGGGADRVQADHINDAGVVVGSALPASGAWKAFAWTRDGGFIDLDSLADHAGYHLSRATRINNRGEIGGIAAPSSAPWSALTGFVLAAPACAADLTGEGVLDLADVRAFIDAFGTQSPPADLNDDGVYDLADVQAFVTGFTAGCT